MAVEPRIESAKNVGSWQEVFRPIRSARVQKARERVRKEAEICLERIRAEIKTYKLFKDQPTIIQRARFLETFLRDKTALIQEDEMLLMYYSNALTIKGE